MKECKHLIKYNSKTQTCGKNQQGNDGKAHCGIDTTTGEFIVYRNCPEYKPVEKKSLSIAEKILKDVGLEEK